MSVDVFRFQFAPDVPLDEAEQTLVLATFAAEGLFGQARVRLDVGYHVDEPRRVLIVDGTTETGLAVVRLFTGLLIREFGDEAFRVSRVCSAPDHQPSQGQAA